MTGATRLAAPTSTARDWDYVRLRSSVRRQRCSPASSSAECIGVSLGCRDGLAEHDCAGYAFGVRRVSVCFAREARRCW